MTLRRSIGILRLTMVPEGHGKDRRRREADDERPESYKSEVGPAVTTRWTPSRTKGALGVFD